MRSLEALIVDMKSTRDISRHNATVATHAVIREVAELYSNLFTGYIERLEQINRLNNFNPAEASEILQLEQLFNTCAEL